MNEKSLSPVEVAAELGIAKNTVYELIKRGEISSYKIGRKIRVRYSEIERLRGEHTARNTAVADRKLPGKPEGACIICGQDTVLDILAGMLENHPNGTRTFRSHQGSYNGLYSLYRGEVDTASCHLWDGDSNSYNLSYIKRMIPGIPVMVIHLVQRMQGFYVPKGNPKNISTWNDLLRRDVRIVNREKSSGTRVLLDEHLRLMGTTGNSVHGYNSEENSHLAIVSAVARGDADTGLGNEKTALQASEVDFIPLQQESYDLVMLRDTAEKPVYSALIEIIQSNAFRHAVEGLGGYDTENTGTILS